ncbi:MAG: hypothetical protein Q9195_004539 [Heterodermia aff. obscurata]
MESKQNGTSPLASLLLTRASEASNVSNTGAVRGLDPPYSFASSYSSTLLSWFSRVQLPPAIHRSLSISCDILASTAVIESEASTGQVCASIRAMAPSTLLSLFTFVLLTPRLLLADVQISQISDGQIQAGPSTTLDALEGRSTTSITPTAAALIPVTALNTTAAVAAPSSTTGSILPTSILMAAPAGAVGAASNYTGLQTVVGSSFPTPHVPIPVGGTVTPTLGALNGTSATATNGPTGLTTLAPAGTSVATESPTSTSTEGPLAASGAASRLSHLAVGKGLVVAGILAWFVGAI